MRCPGCNKFPSFEPMAEWSDEPELNDGRLTATVRVYLESQCCSETCKEATFDVDVQTDLVGEVSFDDPDLEVRYEGKGRGQRTFYGFRATVTIGSGLVELHDDIQASAMDEVA